VKRQRVGLRKFEKTESGAKKECGNGEQWEEREQREKEGNAIRMTDENNSRVEEVQCKIGDCKKRNQGQYGDGKRCVKREHRPCMSNVSLSLCLCLLIALLSGHARARVVRTSAGRRPTHRVGARVGHEEGTAARIHCHAIWNVEPGGPAAVGRT
jgi:hypothetical protein